MSETEAFATAAEVPPAGPVASEPGGGTAPEPQVNKPRSGFARMKVKVARLTELYENVRNDYEAVCADFDRLQAEHDKTLLKCAKLEAANSELDELNAGLAADLQRAKSRPRTGPVRYGITGLMGDIYGR
jgi:hypothetical protein